MNDNHEVVRLAEHLAAAVHKIDISSYAGVFGAAAGTDSALLQMRKIAAELVQAARQGSRLKASIENMESALLTAQLVGLLSQTELAKYLKNIDELHEINR